MSWYLYTYFYMPDVYCIDYVYDSCYFCATTTRAPQTSGNVVQIVNGSTALYYIIIYNNDNNNIQTQWPAHTCIGIYLDIPGIYIYIGTVHTSSSRLYKTVLRIRFLLFYIYIYLRDTIYTYIH